jgi:pyruvate kinase
VRHRRFPVLYEGSPFELAAHVGPGTIIWLGDGDVSLSVTGIDRDGDIICQVSSGSQLKCGRGVTITGAALPLQCITGKDERDLAFLLQFAEIDFIALSFVKGPEDVALAKSMIEAMRSGSQAEPPGVIAKIETREAAARIDAIRVVADAVMVARGDLALQAGATRCPSIQKRVIAACRAYGVPCITATQMLDSMERTPAPTRAEVTDVWNAVWDGTDALMLSGETSIGAFPLQAIATMRSIAEAAEHELFTRTDTEERFHKLLAESARAASLTRRRSRAAARALDPSCTGLDTAQAALPDPTRAATPRIASRTPPASFRCCRRSLPSSRPRPPAAPHAWCHASGRRRLLLEPRTAKAWHDGLRSASGSSRSASAGNSPAAMRCSAPRARLPRA